VPNQKNSLRKNNLATAPRADIPEKPGVYLFKTGDNILYIGKAKNLKKRVEQYFQERAHGFLNNLLHQADDIEFIITENEKDALLLEYNLIHNYQPPFNIRLKDDKSFPVIEITTAEPFPGIYYTRSGDPINKNFHVGPIVDSRKTKEIIDTVTRIFKIRTCSNNTFKKKTACLYHYIDRCSAPCIDKISQEDYLNSVTDTIHLLKGNKSTLLNHLKKKMIALAEDLKFEEADRIKQDIQLIQQFTMDSYISSVSPADYDVICLSHDPDPESGNCFIILFSIVEGRVKRKEFFNFTTFTLDKEEILKDFMVSFYQTENIPPEIIVQTVPNEIDDLMEMFSTVANRRTSIRTPQKGKKKKMLDLAIMNLNLYVNKHNYSQVGARLKSALNLTRFPGTIEGFDISHFSERERVGAAVVFTKGEPTKKQYRNYIIKKAAPGDTEAIKEVLERRFRNRPPEEHPDLLLIDGGKGQLNAALSIKENLNIQSDIVSIAKSEERIFLETGGSILFPEDSPERFLFQNIRDEVHRRAITHHRKRRQKI
jgi:excinuclease ABC subunit C